MQAVIGIIAILGLGYLLCKDRSLIQWRFIAIGLVLQFALATLFLKVAWIAESLMVFNVIVTAIEQATLVGTSFMFGFLGGADAPFDLKSGASLYIFSFRVLPQILVFSVLVAIFWYWGVLPMLVRVLGSLLKRGLNVSGVLGTAAAASLFLGMVEAPLVIRAYLKDMSRSDFFAVMTCGMSTIAGTMMVLYASVLRDVLPNPVGHLFTASIINIIGAIYLSRLLMPEAAQDAVAVKPKLALQYASFMDAITRGTSDGLTLAMHIGAMLLVLSSLVALANGIVGQFSVDGTTLSLEYLTGLLFAPVAWLIGIPWAEAQLAGSIMGTKIILNELIAYIQMAGQADALSVNTRLILTYVLCGSILSGTLVTLMSGAIVALITLF